VSENIATVYEVVTGLITHNLRVKHSFTTAKDKQKKNVCTTVVINNLIPFVQNSEAYKTFKGKRVPKPSDDNRNQWDEEQKTVISKVTLNFIFQFYDSTKSNTLVTINSIEGRMRAINKSK